MIARIVPTSSGLELYTGFDRMLVNDLKSRIPAQDRRPVYVDGKFSHWMIATKHMDSLVLVCENYLGKPPAIQRSLLDSDVGPQTKQLKVKYIGAPKDRGGCERSAFGYCDGEWSVIFPEAVLRAWFEPWAKPDSRDSTHYGMLAVTRDASGAEIKQAHRQMARRYHPDVNKDDDAHDMFIAIQRAYEILSNPMQRKKYDAGLVLVGGLSGQQQQPNTRLWRPPLRCGLITADGESQLGRFVIKKIAKWEPIRNAFGQELVTSWPAGADTFRETWI